MDLAAAFGARHFEHPEISRNGIELEPFGPVHDMPGHIGNAGHEVIAAFLPALHLAQLKFPVARQLGLGQFRNAKAIEQFHERKSLCRWQQLLALAKQVLFIN